MIDIRLYGKFRKLVDGSNASENTVLRIESTTSETFGDLLKRLGLDSSDIGDCFINGRLTKLSDKVEDGDRIGIFPFNMRLIDGGMHLKYHPQRRT
ncbi:MAG: MoaD/ThiS family protein [Promethearchaeia archaeon]